LEIADDLCLPWVFRVDWGAAMDEIPIALKEVGRGGHVGWNDVIVSANAIYLDGQHHRNTELLQIPRELHDRGPANALLVNDPPRRLAFLRVQLSVVVSVEGPAYEFQRRPPFRVLDGRHLHVGQTHLPQLLRQPANARLCVVPRIAPAHEA